MIYVRTGEIIFVVLRIRELKKSNLKSQKHEVESKNQNWKSPALGIDLFMLDNSHFTRRKL